MHSTAVATICFGGFFARPYLEKHLEKKECFKDMESSEVTRKVAAHAVTTMGGALIGGLLKGIRTRTCKGVMVGIIVGAVSSAIGSVLSEVRLGKSTPKNNK